MDLTPKMLTDDVEFREVRRGYDPNEVDDFLDGVAAAVAQLQHELADARQRAADAEERLRREPPAAAPEEQAGAEEIQRTLVLAQRTADAALREAREEAARLTSESKAAAAQVLGDAEEEARRRRAEAHETLTGEIEALGSVREALRNDVIILERHIEEQRVQLRSSVAELERLLDDPSLFRTPAPEGLSAVEAPARPAAATPAAEEADPGRAPDTGALRDDLPTEPAAAVNGAPAASAPAGAAPDTDAVPPDGAPQAPATADGEAEPEDAFLAELRKAMTDDEPLGPRDLGEASDADENLGSVPGAARPRPRFGRRR